MSIINIIKSSPLFYELFDKEVDAIIENCNVMSLEEGQKVFAENDEGDEIFIILTGACSVQKSGLNLVNLGKGDLFGEMVLLDERRRTADVVASTYTDILVLSYGNIFNLYKKNPRVFSILILNLSRLLAKRLKDTSEQIKGLRKLEKIAS
ncbi:cyclic nucleotide-binding domain-containing protein [Bacteriovoracaceae bacterium]|nr:cyclic nucleotide-binding domain-containing protein [Bacteriovoracaceae bacterium]